MGMIVNPAIISDPLPITVVPIKLLTADFRLPHNSDYRLPIVANKQKFADYRWFSRQAGMIDTKGRQADR
jgi:hypothetical protein